MVSNLHKHIARILLATLALTLGGNVFGQTLQIDSLKANYLEGFMDFIRRDGIELPTETVVGIIEDHDLAIHLNALAEQPNRNRTLRIVHLTAKQFENKRVPKVDILFVGSGNKNLWLHLFDRSNVRNTLLVGEEKGFLDAGGGIEFLVIKNRLRFRVNTANLSSHNFQLSSKLLELAVE